LIAADIVIDFTENVGHGRPIAKLMEVPL